MARALNVGTDVIYRMTKQSPRPGPRASDVRPSAHGEHYRYHVDKFWTVLEKGADGRIVLVTRTGKRHVVGSDDPNLRCPSFLERWRYRGRWPRVEELERLREEGGSGPPSEQQGGAAR